MKRIIALLLCIPLGLSNAAVTTTAANSPAPAGVASITSGAIDGATIGATTPSSGAFTTLTTSGIAGIGGATSASLGLSMTGSITSGAGTTQRGVNIGHTCGTDATAVCDGVRVGITTAAGSYTSALVRNFVSGAPTKGSGSTITSAIGFQAADMSAGTNNIGFQGSLASGSNKYNLYLDGSAQNWISGDIRTTSGNALLLSATTPTISSGFGTSPSVTASNGSATFRINVGTGGVATTGVIGLPAATTGWNCFMNNITNNATSVMGQTASTTTSATIANYSRTTGVAAAWAASDIISVSCLAY